jgi:hypothetical protein
MQWGGLCASVGLVVSRKVGTWTLDGFETGSFMGSFHVPIAKLVL